MEKLPIFLFQEVNSYLKDTVLSKLSQLQTDKYYTIPLT